MITFVEGDIFESPAQVLTNTINCVGVMGKGIALEFKKRFPEMYADYKRKCQVGEVQIGKPYLWQDDKVQILNFPTKHHWKYNSQLSYIEDGLKYLAKNFAEMGICSLALAPLGCGNGGLSWANVRRLMEQYLGDIPNLEVFAYIPKQAKHQVIPTEDETSRLEVTSLDQLVSRPECNPI